MSNLTETEKRVLIAKALGFKFEVDTRKRVNAFTAIWTPDGKRGSRKAGNDEMALTLAMKECVPDFFLNLDSMHEAEKAIPANKRGQYVREVVALIKKSKDQEWHELHATAAQRAESFGITLGLWS
jgi:hypothetical protein